MTPAAPLPLPEGLPLPGPVWLFHALLLLTFFLHVLAMNLMLGGSVIAAIARLRAPSGSPPHEVARLAGKALPTVVASAVSLGVAALLFAQVLYGRVLFASSILMAWSWFAVVPMLVLAYYAAYATAKASPAAVGRAVITALVAAALFVIIAFVYSNNMSLALRPDAFVAMYSRDATGRWLNLGDLTLWPRYLHAVLGSLAVGGWGLALLAYVGSPSDVARAWGVRHGFTWLATATALNVLAGGAWFLALARPVRDAFHGGEVVASVVLAAGVLLSLVLVAQAWRARTGAMPGRAIATTGGTLALTIALMVLTRDTVRSATLEAQGYRPVPWVAPQWPLIVLFLLLLVVALATIAWMVRALWTARHPVSTTAPRQAVSGA